MALLKFKRSAVPAKVPALNDLALGELAINTYDGKVYTKKDNGTASIVEVGGGGGVTSFNTRTGAVTLSGSDVTTALGYTPASTSGPTFSNGITVNNGDNQVQIAFDGNLEIVRAAGNGYIDFKNTVGEDYDSRIQQIGSGFAMTGTVSAGDEFRAPIFRDSDNTAYYLDPHNGSNLYTTKFNTATNGAAGRTIAIKDASTSEILFGAYPGGWTSALQIQNNDNSDFVWISPLDVNNNARVRTGGCGLDFYTDGGNDTGTYSLFVGSGYATGQDSLRAPIFYDSNDTAYFIDPNGNSTVNNLYAGGGLFVLYNSIGDKVDGSPWYGMGGTTSGTVQVAGYYGLRLRTASSIVDLVSDYAQANNSFRAPIFYDSNNTGYYVDPASGSILGGNVSILGGRNITFDTSGGSLTIKGDSGGWGTGLYFLGSAGTNRGGFGALGGGDGLSYLWAGNAYNDAALYIYPSGYAQAAASLRAPIFYDSNNTGYFLDATAAGLALRTYGYWQQDTTDWAGDINGKIQYHDNSWYFSAANQWVFRASSGAEPFRVTQGGIAIASADMRAPVFYDSISTGFYVDPNSSSRLERLVLSARYDNYFVGSMAVVNAVNNFQTLTDTFGQMNVMQVSDTSGFTNGPTGLYPYGAVMSWRTENHSYQMYASHTGDLAYKTQWNNDNYTGWQTPVIYGRIGNSASGRAIYGSVYYDSDDTAFYTSPNTTSNVSEMVSYSYRGNGNVGGTGSASWHPSGIYSAGYNWLYGGISAGGGDITAVNEVYANRYYDGGNTAFYVDPASTSNLSGLTVSSRISGSISGDAQRLFNHTGANNDGLQYWNTVGNDTLNPNTGWHYAIRMGHGDADTYYSATLAVDFFADNVWLRRKVGGTNQTWKRFVLYDDDYSATLRATIFYDVSNTAYYLDAASTGTSLNVAGSVVAAGNVTAYSDIRIKANVETIPDALDKLDQIRGVTYTRTDLDDKEQRYAGVIAQEIEAVLPEAVRDLGNIKAVDYNATIALLIEAVKELALKVKTLEEKDN